MSDPFKDALRKMNTCPGCPNDLVCHDQGECLRPTPETDALDWSSAIGDTLEQRRTQLARIHEVTSRLERQRDEAREENARLREALANATCLILAVGEPKETEGHQHGWYEARKIVLEQVNKLTL
jgi:hypothetical protein